MHVISVTLSTHKASCQILSFGSACSCTPKIEFVLFQKSWQSMFYAVECSTVCCGGEPEQASHKFCCCMCLYVHTYMNIYWSCYKQQKWKVYCMTEIQVTIKDDTLRILKWCCFTHIMVLYMHINFPNLACLRHARLVNEQRVAEVCCLVTFGDKIGVLWSSYRALQVQADCKVYTCGYTACVYMNLHQSNALSKNNSGMTYM